MMGRLALAVTTSNQASMPLTIATGETRSVTSYAALSAVKQVPFVADDQGSATKERCVGTEETGERLRGCDQGSGIVETSNLISGGNRAAVHASRGDAHRVESANERNPQLGRE
ncbi:MAG TPA: hypothetical protein VGF76_05640, partial [Polyangiaceae bacterium]|jgi:uncharacterized membrane protein